ncbi:Bug family tripartite tricarboxylate transporter substrate binding protein [Falsiroseomonas oryzae]|uniref:Bug family tripartite tricarboxylate transporter substrate binding protein n=1 Tax=Falsiroseomonas oryzae TaxID=2766473 RepID=UPI0022EAEC28|nr:tripartite tricarboxylate transporter substrate binding protein [Roseomonas sp. MO-31]
MSHAIPRRTMGRILIAGGLALGGPARAQPAFPNRPLRLVVPFPAGGTTDILARIVAEPLGRRLGQPVVVDNRPGAGGGIGADQVAKADPDGHTLLMTTIGTAAINYGLYPNLPYKASDLAAVTNVADVPNIIIAAPGLQAGTLAEAVALGKRSRDGLTIGSSGNGTSLHLTGELLRQAAGIDLIHVPFRGSAPMLTEIIAGRVDLAVDNLPSSLAHIREGRLKGLAVTTARRSPALPDVPTTREAGFPQVDAVAWFGIQAPARTPKPILDRLAQEIRAVVQDPAVAARIAEQGGEPVGNAPEEFEAFIRREIARWGEVIRNGNVTVD